MIVLGLGVRAPHEGAAVLDWHHFDYILENNRILEYSLHQHLDSVLVDVGVADGVEEG